MKKLLNFFRVFIALKRKRVVQLSSESWVEVKDLTRKIFSGYLIIASFVTPDKVRIELINPDLISDVIEP